MSDGCGEGGEAVTPVLDKRYRRILLIALAANASMFVIELGLGLRADSAALLADAVDFMGDAGNYALSLFVLGLAPVWRSRTAFAKGTAMGLYGLFVLGAVLWNLDQGVVPEARIMGWTAMLALLVNISVAVLLFTYRTGDANMRSVWLCSRNDAISNIAVMLAALGVAGTGSGWPDILVAFVMGLLGVSASKEILQQARSELASPPDC